MTRHDPVAAIRHMRDHAAEAAEMARGRSREDLDTDRLLNLALVRLLAMVGEGARLVPEEFRARHAAVPWCDISDRGSRLIHGYDTINFDIVWAVIQDELPPLVEQLNTILCEDPRGRGESSEEPAPTTD